MKIRKHTATLVMALLMLLPLGAFAQNDNSSPERIQREVRHELVMLPTYSVFDNLAYKVDGNTVTLYGQVIHSELKSEAQNVVKKIEGVDKVDNNIQILPPFSNDDHIRRAIYRSIYGEDGFMKYAIEAVPPIHIIVNNGHVTLDGVVDNETDKNLAGIRAQQVPGTFEVKNNLQVDNQYKAKK